MAAKAVEFTVHTRLRDVDVILRDIRIAPRDVTVGIMGDYPDGYKITLLHSSIPVDYDQLTVEEQELLDNAVMEEYEKSRS